MVRGVSVRSGCVVGEFGACGKFDHRVDMLYNESVLSLHACLDDVSGVSKSRKSFRILSNSIGSCAHGYVNP